MTKRPKPTGSDGMFTARQSLFIKGSAGDPLPVVWKALETKGVKLLRGQLCLVCAGPGTGKSAFALTYALKAKVPTLYFSADSDAFTQVSRMVAILTGWSLEKATKQVLDNDLTGIENDLASVPIRFNYSASPSLDQIETSMKAYDEVYGDFPELVIVDNVTNVRAGVDDEDPFSGLESLMDYLHDMARATSACVVGLHHVTGGYNDSDKPIPLSGVKGQISRVPELILTLYRVSQGFGPDHLRVAAVKNRYGKSDASGSTYSELEFQGDHMAIRDF